jgi:hypothetical protein
MTYDLLEAGTPGDLSRQLTQLSTQGWQLVSLHVTERANGEVRYTALLCCKG